MVYFYERDWWTKGKIHFKFGEYQQPDIQKS